MGGCRGLTSRSRSRARPGRAIDKLARASTSHEPNHPRPARGSGRSRPSPPRAARVGGREIVSASSPPPPSPAGARQRPRGWCREPSAFRAAPRGSRSAARDSLRPRAPRCAARRAGARRRGRAARHRPRARGPLTTWVEQAGLCPTNSLARQVSLLYSGRGIHMALTASARIKLLHCGCEPFGRRRVADHRPNAAANSAYQPRTVGSAPRTVTSFR